jgi:uncharacterized protein (DUF4415 family)
MNDREIDLSDLPEVPPERFASAILREGLQPVAPKAQITLRIDAEVLQWFRSKGAGYQSRMNAVLRAYWAICAAGGVREPPPPARRDAAGTRGPRVKMVSGRMRKKRGEARTGTEEGK